MTGRQKAAGIVFQAAAGNHAEAQHNESWEILVLAAKSIADPGSQTGPTGIVRTRMQEQDSGRVNWQLSLHRTDHGQVVCAARHMREQFAHGHAVFAVLLEPPRTFQPLPVFVGSWILRLGKWFP